MALLGWFSSSFFLLVLGHVYAGTLRFAVFIRFVVLLLFREVVYDFFFVPCEDVLAVVSMVDWVVVFGRVFSRVVYRFFDTYDVRVWAYVVYVL